MTFRAPAGDGEAASWPPLDEAGHLLAHNRQRLGSLSQAQNEVLAAAVDYLRQAGEPVPDLSTGPLLVAGHQSELFHPGVWVKNFALAGLARRHGGTALNLIVDNDIVKSLALRWPTLTRRPHLASTPFDDGPIGLPAEEYHVRNESLFASLPTQSRDRWPFEPILPRYWREVLRASRPGVTLGERLAAGRRALERSWGVHNFELPVSRLARTQAFARFASDLLLRLPEFHALYNRSVRDYRAAHRVRSRHHPVPELASEDDWLEAPFWAWRAGGRRGRLFVRRQGAALELRSDGELWPALPAAALPERWPELEHQGLKIRPRALTNTLFVRVFVGELFVHGLGGGKYDEVTDRLIEGLYGLEAPGYLTLTATLRLPFPPGEATEQQRQWLAWLCRDLRCNPQRYLAGREMSEAAAQRQGWVERQPTDRRGRIERFRRLREWTAALAPAVEAQRLQAKERLHLCEKALKQQALLRRRDFAFCLHPEDRLRALMALAEREAGGTIGPFSPAPAHREAPP